MSIRRILRNKKFKKFIKSLSNLKDIRQKGKIKHPLEGCLTIIILSMLSGCNYFREYVLFAKEHESKLKKLNLIPNGIPSHDTLERMAQKIDKNELNLLLVNLLFPVINNRPIISIDGKCIRATKDSSLLGTYQNMKDIVTMFISDKKLSLLSLATNDKSNERITIPLIIKLFHDLYPDVKPYLTIDGIAITHEILGLLVEYGYDFAIVYKYSKDTINEFKILSKLIGKTKDVVKNSSRIEKRIFSLFDIKDEDIVGIEQWKDYISYIGKMESEVYNLKKNETTNSEYYYFVSDINISDFMRIRRKHWSIENSLHYVLDNSFVEDRLRMKKGHASENMNLLRKFVLNIIYLSKTDNESASSFRDSLKYNTPQELLYRIMKVIA